MSASVALMPVAAAEEEVFDVSAYSLESAESAVGRTLNGDSFVYYWDSDDEVAFYRTYTADFVICEDYLAQYTSLGFLYIWDNDGKVYQYNKSTDKYTLNKTLTLDKTYQAYYVCTTTSGYKIYLDTTGRSFFLRDGEKYYVNTEGVSYHIVNGVNYYLDDIGEYTKKGVYTKVYLGDVNSDGSANSLDATAILIYYAAVLNGDKPVISSFGDVDRNGSINSLDATLILIYYASVLNGYTKDIYTFSKSYNKQ
jgi:hypothetical protein